MRKKLFESINEIIKSAAAEMLYTNVFTKRQPESAALHAKAARGVAGRAESRAEKDPWHDANKKLREIKIVKCVIRSANEMC